MAAGIETESPSGVTAPPSGQGPAAPKPCRPFNVGDAMIAVGALAVAMALVRIIWAYYAASFHALPFGELSGFGSWWKYLTAHPLIVGAVAACACSALMVLLLVASLAFLAMRLRQPSPPLEELVRQPGMAAVGAIWAGVFAGVIVDGYGLPVAIGILTLGLPVPAAWAVLAWTGRWKPEPGWIDRFGRWLGVRWCLLVGFYAAAVAIALAFAPEPR